MLQKILQSIGSNKKTLFFLFLIFITAFAVRGHLLKYELFFEFDSYYHARIVSYLLKDGAIPQKDPLAYYQLGGATLPATGLFFWYFNALMYKVFTLGAPYNKDLWIFFVKVLPALYGSVISVLMYFLGKELYGKKAGYAMAFFAAVVPAFVYRTMSGFFEEDSFGFIWMIAGLTLFVKATKHPEFSRKKILLAASAGIMFGIMAWTWNMFILVPLLLTAYLPFALLLLYAKKSSKELVDFLKLFAITFAVFVAMATPANSTWISVAVNYVLGVIPGNIPVFVIGIALLLVGMLAYIMFVTGKKTGANQKRTVSVIAMIAMYAIILLIATVFLVIPDYRGRGVLENTVGEESTGKESFGSKYNALIIFPVLALLLLPYRAYRRKDEHYSALVFFWVAITLFMAWYKLKFTYTFGLPIAAAAGVVSAEMFYFLDPKKSLSAKIVASALALMFLVGIAAASVFVVKQPPNIETDFGWKPALEWLRENTPQDAKIFNWWDQGHWISFLSERKVFLDNRNSDYAGDQNFALFLIETDLEKSMKILRKYDPDYVLLNWDMLGSIISFTIYAYDTLDVSHPGIQKFNVGPNIAFPCSPVQDAGQKFYQCGANRIPEQQMNGVNTTWQAVPTQLVDNRTPLFVYTDNDKRVLYLLNVAVNDTTIAKMWFGHPDTRQYFELVYNSQGIKIFKVKK